MIEGWFDGVCEPKNPGGHAAWGATVKVNGHIEYRDGGYCGFGPAMSNNVAEYSAVIQVLKFINHTLVGDVIICGDSRLVIEQLKGRWRVNGGLYLPYYREAKKLYDEVRSKNKVVLQWISRNDNGICDELSKQVLRDKGICFSIQPEVKSSKLSEPQSVQTVAAPDR